MRLSTFPGVFFGCLAMLVAIPLAAQSISPDATKSLAGRWRRSTLRFSEGRAVLGVVGSRSRAYCSNDGTAFFNVDEGSDSSSAPALFSISSTAEVKHLQRKVPVNFTTISIRDFFAGDQTLVTLLRAEQRDDSTDPAAPPREIRYFLSTSDHDGDHASLLPLDLKFRPLRIALFGSGDFLVLGWDDANLLPLMVLLKDDGTIRRFIDLDHKPAEPYGAYGSAKEVESSKEARLDLATLQRATLVPFGKEVLLTYPGTAKAIRVLSAVGEDRSIPIKLPGGYVLHDVLVSGEHYTGSLILRAEELPDATTSGKGDAAPKPPPQMFEMHANNGSLLRELLFDRPAIADVACAPDNKLTAILNDTVANVVQPADVTDGKSASANENATQLVVTTARR